MTFKPLKSLFLTLTAVTLVLGTATQSQAAVVFTEVNYNSPEFGADTNEYIELTNLGSVPVTMDGYKLLFGGNVVRFTFPSLSIQPMQSVLVTVNAPNLLATSGKTADELVYNVLGATQVFQWNHGGGLGNNSDTLVLTDSTDATLATMGYSEIAPWPARSGPQDGGGATLEILDLHAADLYAGSNWYAGEVGGSPGWVPIPEPTALLSVALAGIGLLSRRRRLS